MPALPSVSKVLKIALVWSDSINTNIVTRFYIQYSGSAPSPGDLDTMAAGVTTAYASNLLGGLHESISLIRCEIIDLTSPTSAAGLVAGSVAGTATGDMVPIDAAVVSSYAIPRRYRGGHPRGYWPHGIAVDLDNPQRWTSAFITAQQGAIETFFADVLAATWSGSGTLSHVNVSYFHGFTVVTSPTTGRARNVPTVRATPVVDAVTAIVARLRIGTQRRRLQYN